MKTSNEWWTSPQESENGRMVIVTGRDDMEGLITKGKHKYRVEVVWRYESRPDGMPVDSDARLLEEVTEALQKEFDADPVAVMTGIYTGDGQRDWVFYTFNLRLFGIVFNRALEDLPTIPFAIDAYEDPDWEEYRDMREKSYIDKE